MKILPAHHLGTDGLDMRRRVIDDDDIRKIGTIPDLVRQIGQARPRCDEETHVAITHDVGDLARLQNRIYWHENDSCRGSSEHGHDRLKPLFEVYSDPL